ncbi:unnamed protein product [Rotaria socialis]|uniref:Uncharacterized protein n=2 Tax=Rotaria socialis TaxID=392032 RepID=A0A817W8E0_9BILA|nr:unnamed protein product [Rotaria socialis]CAF4339190.1 unnamed protein product [Rotaria socialis]
MTKGGSGKPKTLGRLIFGDKRKPHASPARHRSSTQNGANVADPASSVNTGVNKASISLQDWAIWRIQLNEQMSSAIGDLRTDLKQMRHFLQSNSFYQKHSRGTSNGSSNGVRLLFYIPRANFNPELVDELRENTKVNTKEIGEPIIYEEKKIRSNSDDRTTTSVNSMSALQAGINDKPISRLLPKISIGNTSNFLHTNEQIKTVDRIHPRRSIRHSFVATDRIHATLQKAVKDGNVLEKIKAFEMQAAAAQAESGGKLSGVNYRIQSVASSIQSATQHRLSPAVVHPIKNEISPIPMQYQKQEPVRSSRGRYVHPVQQQPCVNPDPTIGHKSGKGAHVLEPAHGDIILKRRTPSQKTANDEDYSITAISSMAHTASQLQLHHRNPAHHTYHHRTSISRSRNRQDVIYEKHTANKNDNVPYKCQHKSKERATPSSKLSTHRRWLKGRKGTPTETPNQVDKKQISTIKSNKASATKKKNSEQEQSNAKSVSTTINQEKFAADNNRVYGVPSTIVSEQTKNELPSLQTSLKLEEKNETVPKKDTFNETNAFISLQQENANQIKQCDTGVLPMKIQRRSSRSSHHQKLSSIDIEGEMISKIDDNNRFCRSATDIHVHRADSRDDDDDVDDYDQHDNGKSDDDVFFEASPTKSRSKIIRHQSVVNLPKNESRRFQQQSSCTTIRRHASQCSSNEFTYDQRYLQTKENSQLILANAFMKKPPPPITIITRKNRLMQNEQIAYEEPQLEQTEIVLLNNHTVIKKRPCNTITTTTGTSECSNGQNNNKQVSKQILHAIMNSMNNNQEQSTAGPPMVALSSTVNDEFFENGPLTNPEETIVNITD